MTKSNKKILVLLTTAVAMMTVSHLAFAALPEPKSEGKFFASKGTKAEAGAEEELGGSFYEYGKGLRLGPSYIKPFIGYTHQWDNNIFMDENAREEDHIHQVNAGATAELPLGGGQHLLTGTYRSETEWFERYDSQNHTDHMLNANLDLNFVPFTLSTDETFSRTVDRAGTEFTSRVDRKENTVRSLLEVPFSQFFLETEVFDLNVDYRLPENDPFDHHDFTIYQRAGIDIGPATQLLGEYGYKNIHYFEDSSSDLRDGDAHQGSIGLRGNWTERVTYQVWGGYQMREYDLDSAKDFNGFIARGGVRYMVSEVSTISLRGDRSPQESTFDGQNFYVRNRVEFAWRHQLAERWFFNNRENFQFNRYTRESLREDVFRTRKDSVWESSFGLEYRMPNDMVSFFGEYKYRARESNLPQLSYDDQTITTGVKVNF